MNMIANNCVSDELICLVCNLNLKDLSCINIFCTSLSHNEELLASFVLGILHPSALELNSNYICLQCYNLFQMLEQARWTAKNIESEIFKIYQSSRDKRKLNKDKIIINTIKNANDLVNKNVNLQEKLNIPTNFDQLNQMQTFESLNDECNIREKNHPIIIEDIHSTNLQIIKVPSIDISSNNTNLILIDKNECILPSINTDSLNELSNYNQEKSNMPKKHKEKIAIDNSVSLKINTNDFSNKEDCLELNNISTEALKNTIPNNEVCEIFNDNNGVLSNINQNNIQNKESSKINKKKEKINIQSSKTVKKSKCDSKQSNYPCPTCEKTWRTSSELKSHVKTHSSMRPYMCEKCGQAYKHKHALEIHIGMHNGINPFQCDFCNKCFTQKGALMRHLPIHTGEMPYQCEICGKRFVHHTSYNMHTLSHTGKKTHQCPNCDLSLLSTSHLKRHMRVHTGEKPYSCPSCGKRFAERYNLCAHQKIHGTTQIINKSTKKIQYKCERCLISFNTQENFQDHIQQHRTQIEMESNVEWIKPQEESTSINQIINNNWNNFSYTKQLQTSHHQLFND